MKIIKILTAALLALSLSFTATGCGTNVATTSAKTRDESTDTAYSIRIGVNSLDNNFLLKILDNHTDFLKDKGINLETTEFAAGINTIDAITTDTVDIGLFATYAGVNRIGNTIDDTELRAFAMIDKTQNYYLYVNPNTISTPEDLAGHVAVSQAGVVFEYYYGELFKQYDINPDDVTIANVSSVQEALALANNGQGDAYWVAAANESMFKEEGWEKLLGIGDINISMYTFLVANESYLEEHKDEIANYLTVSEEGFEYIDENLDEFAGWIEEDIGLNQQIFKDTWNSKRHYYSFDQEAYNDLDYVKDWCYQNGRFDTDYDVADYINTDALAEAFPDRVSWSAE